MMGLGVKVSEFRNSQTKERKKKCPTMFPLQTNYMLTFQIVGEAEALCAQLTAEGLADAVVSPDGDALCFGAKCASVLSVSS